MASSVAVPHARQALRIAANRRWSRTLPSFFAPEDRPGFSAVVATDVGANAPMDRDDRNQARDAMAQVVGAARGRVAAVEAPRWRLAWPVVLIDGPLIELDFDEGEERLVSVEAKRVLWYASPYGEPVAVDIVRLADFERYVSSAMEGLWAVFRRLEEDRKHFLGEANLNKHGHPNEMDESTWRRER